MKEGDFAGYDPVQRRFFCLVREEASLNEIQQEMTEGCTLPTQKNVAVSLEGDVPCRILMRSGAKGTLARLAVDERMVRSTKVEAAIVEADHVELWLEVEGRTGLSSNFFLKDTITLENNRPSIIKGEASGSGKSIRVNAEIVEP